ncbi:MAG TPA: hypothetical protein VEQ36_11685 [Thermomicrobiales bacterium]|nr:hypothetical protein [Thermomicrobiales bacterium]
MTQRLDKAIRDNVELCTAVCRAHGIASREADGLWRTLSPAPPYYPDAITVESKPSSEHAAAVLDEIGGASIKDSFATLDLTTYGFDLLFRAEWIWCEPGAGGGRSTLEWLTITDPADFAAWRTAHGSAESILPALFAEPGITVLGGSSPGTFVGALISTLAGVVGVSNVFATGVATAEAWRELVAYVLAQWPGMPIVGYEKGPDLAAAINAGFEPIGPLQVWLRHV